MAGKLKILFVSSEVAPFAKTGGLADVSGALPLALNKLGHDVRVFLPYYRMVREKFKPAKVVPSLPIPISDHSESAAIYQIEHNGVTFYFLEQNKYYDRQELYGTTTQGDYPDNAERFIYFARATMEAAKQLNFRPDVIHCNDWQTGLIPVYLKSIYQNDPFFKDTGSMLTVHNLAYQGSFWHWDIHLTGLGWEYFVPHWIEFYGKINLLKSGILHADKVTTVSNTYAQEIQTPEYGCNLDAVLRARKGDLAGIVNGIDYDIYDPAGDKLIPQKYDAKSADMKKINKKELQSRFNLPQTAGPLIGIVSRLADQKGFDILAQAMNSVLKLGVQIVILGTGEQKYHDLLSKIAAKHPAQVGLKLAYDGSLAQLIYAGSDFFLMPSQYEPCGLGQLISLRYGTIPIVRHTGGLADTIEEFSVKTKKGNGFGFSLYSSKALVSAVKRALSVYEVPKMWEILVQNAFACDFSWKNSANEYVKLYEEIHHRKMGWKAHNK